MPRQIFEVNVFNSGIITSADEKDIPNDAASYSLNVENFTDDGKITPIQYNRTLGRKVGFNGTGIGEISFIPGATSYQGSSTGSTLDKNWLTNSDFGVGGGESEK